MFPAPFLKANSSGGRVPKSCSCSSWQDRRDGPGAALIYTPRAGEWCSQPLAGSVSTLTHLPCRAWDRQSPAHTSPVLPRLLNVTALLCQRVSTSQTSQNSRCSALQWCHTAGWHHPLYGPAHWAGVLGPKSEMLCRCQGRWIKSLRITPQTFYTFQLQRTELSAVMKNSWT